jgi:hypothetical protein
MTPGRLIHASAQKPPIAVPPAPPITVAPPPTRLAEMSDIP